MVYYHEPDVVKGKNPEKTFHSILREAVEETLRNSKERNLIEEYFVLDEFGLDIAVFIEPKGGSIISKFLELKAFVGQRPSGVGFGNNKGLGTQIDLLLLDDSQLKLADRVIRWILVDGRKPKGTDRYFIFNSAIAREAVMGNVSRGKQNNLNVNRLYELVFPMTWGELLRAVEEFLIGK